MFDRNNNCSEEFNEALRQDLAEMNRMLDSVLDKTGFEIVDYLPGQRLSGAELDAAIIEEAKRLLGPKFKELLGDAFWRKESTS